MHPDGTNQTWTTLNEKLTQLSSPQSERSVSSIYRVHRHLRNVNPKAYEPEIVAIGPYHRHGDADHLQIMEDHKMHYLGLLLRRKGKQNADEYVAAIEREESKARKCYAEPINLDKTEFIQMLVLDGCFIVELVRKFSEPYLRETNDPIFELDWIISSLNRDLLLFENQVPFFVLCELYDLIEAPNQRSRLAYLLINFFKILCPQELTENVDINEMKHLLSLIRHVWISPQVHHSQQANVQLTITGGSVREKEKRLRFIDSATGLREANVQFERNESATQLDIKFEDGVIKMAPLTVEDRTECLFRNLIAYEQYFYHDQDRFVTDYVKFLDCLIDSSKDVEVLSRYGIIENWLGDEEVVATMVNRLTDSVSGPGNSFKYADVFEKVNKHCKHRRNRWMAKLRRNYLNSPWGVISIIVALVLLLLTVTQTVLTILQVVL